MAVKDIPFYSNRADKPDSCMLATIRGALEYLTRSQYSWEDMEALLGYRPGRAAWTVEVWTKLAMQEFDIHMIEAFDYQRYADEGESYLRTFLKPEELAWQREYSNLLDIKPFLPRFLKTVRREQRSPQLRDIDLLLAQGYLVLVQLNLNVLNHKPGYVAHMILIHDKTDGTYVAHDPGLPPYKNRRIMPAKLLAAMGGEHNTVEVTGIKK